MSGSETISILAWSPEFLAAVMFAALIGHTIFCTSAFSAGVSNHFPSLDIRGTDGHHVDRKA